MTSWLYRCINCKKTFPSDKLYYLCSDCENNLFIEYDLNSLKKKNLKDKFANEQNNTIWKYNSLFPTNESLSIPAIRQTPLYRVKNLEKKYGIKEIFLKDETSLPSGSLKDRASSVAIAVAKERNCTVVCGASTGNAGSSTACLCANEKIPAVIFVPEKAPEAKLAQIKAYGANIVRVKGTYDDAYDLCLKASSKYNWYNRNTGYNPFTREGKKTVAFEICEQLKWDVPDFVIIPVGDGNIASGVWKGFLEFYNLALIDKLPKLIFVQASGSNAIVKAFKDKKEVQKVSGKTIADSISVSMPRDAKAALLALKESNGFAIELDDSEIKKAIINLASETGVFVEPAAAASYAGLIQAIESSIVKATNSVVLLLTGNGLKDIRPVLEAKGKDFLIQKSKDLDALKGIRGNDFERE